MVRTLVLCVCLALFPPVLAAAEEVPGDGPTEAKEPSGMSPAVLAIAEDGSGDDPSDAKELSGMSVIGNDEAPKSLYIVPWKRSEIGVETSLDTMLNEGDVPVDRDVFKRQLGYYRVSTGK